MGRGESAPPEAGRVVHAKAVAGCQVVVLAWSVPDPAARRGCLGFAIRKSAAGRQWWLPSGGRRFASRAAPSAEEEEAGEDAAAREAREGAEHTASTHESPIQGFGWCDYAGEPGAACTYLICPVYAVCAAAPAGDPAAGLEVREAAGAEVAVRLETNGADQPHEVWFNRGVAGSQAYSRRFGAKAPAEVPDGAAWPWLSNGLGEALLAFIGRAGAGWELRGAFYEFTWLPALRALADASRRGADVRVVVDGGASAPRVAAPAPAASAAGGREDLEVPFREKDAAKELGARWDAEAKVWYAPAGAPGSAELLERWGPRERRAPAAPAGGGREDLKVPFREKDAARELGARWDAEAKVWYVPAGAPGRAKLLERWGLREPGASPAQEEVRPLEAEAAIGSVAGLEELVSFRRRCAGVAHNKFVVLVPPGGDAPSVWTGSTNLTESGVFGQSNVGHVVNGDRAVAEEYLAYWQKLEDDCETRELARWNASCVEDAGLPLAGGAAPVGETSARAVMSPRPTLALLDHYARLLGQARSCACLTAAFGVNRKLADVLASEDGSALAYLVLEQPGKTFAQLSANPRVRTAVGAVLGARELRDGLEEDAGWTEECLTGLNRHVHFVHEKLLLVDPLGDAPVVVTGSANFSQASVEKNDENVLFIAGDLRCADLYFVEFWRLYRHWKFRDAASQRALDRREDRKVGREERPPLRLSLAEDDSWAEAFYERGSPKCLEREMLMAMHVPAAQA